MSRFIQFELWKDCKQGCKFCCNKGQPFVNKIESCKYVMQILDELKQKQTHETYAEYLGRTLFKFDYPEGSRRKYTYDYIGLIGGEFFNGELTMDVVPYFYRIIRKINDLNPKKIFITTSLIFNMEKYLLPFLEIIEGALGIQDKIVLCTSWDAKYRFKNKEQELLWEKNMLRLHNEYPKVELHTEMIITQHLINKVLLDELSIPAFREKFHTTVDFIEPSSGLYYKDKYNCEIHIPGFFPTVSSFIKFLNKIRNDVDLDTLLSMELRSEELYFIENGQRRVARDRRKTDGRCELSDKSKKYDIGFIDSDEKMRNIVIMFKDIIG